MVSSPDGHESLLVQLLLSCPSQLVNCDQITLLGPSETIMGLILCTQPIKHSVGGGQANFDACEHIDAADWSFLRNDYLDIIWEKWQWTIKNIMTNTYHNWLL